NVYGLVGLLRLTVLILLGLIPYERHVGEPQRRPNPNPKTALLGFGCGVSRLRLCSEALRCGLCRKEQTVCVDSDGRGWLWGLGLILGIILIYLIIRAQLLGTIAALIG